MATVIKLKRSTTASGVPTTSDLVDGEEDAPAETSETDDTESTKEGEDNPAE